MCSRQWIWFGFCVIAVFVMTSTGCSGHLVRVVGKIPPDASVAVPPGSRIYFFEHSRDDSGNTGLIHLRKKVENTLTECGYQPSDIQHADYFMVLNYGVSSDRTVRETIPMITAYATFNGVIVKDPNGSAPSVQPGSPVTTMIPHTRTVHDVWVITRLMDGNHYRQHRTMKEVWSGKAWISDKRTASMAKAVGAMLPHLISSLGQTTQKEAIITSGDIFFQSVY